MLVYRWRRYSNLDRFNQSNISIMKGQIIRDLNANGFFTYSYISGCTNVNLDVFDREETKFIISTLLHTNNSDGKITTLHINEHLHRQNRPKILFGDNKYRVSISTKFSPIPLGKVRIFNFKGTKLVHRPRWRRFKFQRF